MTPSELLSYDQSAPLELRVVGTERRGTVEIKDVTFESGGEPVSAYLVVPDGKGPFAGVVYAHWYGAGGDRKKFLDEAVAMSPRGVVSILPQGSFPWRYSPDMSVEDRKRVAAEAVQLRRAIDVLTARSDVDANRIGFVGHDYGAMYGALVAGFDRRPQSFVLMTPDATFGDWFIKYFGISEEEGSYRRAFESLDPAIALKRAVPGSLFLQFAREDRYVSPEARARLIAAAPEPVRFGLYDASHSLGESAQQERVAWLVKRLRLK